MQYLNRVFKLTDSIKSRQDSHVELESKVLASTEDGSSETKDFLVSVLKLMADYESQISSHR